MSITVDIPQLCIYYRNYSHTLYCGNQERIIQIILSLENQRDQIIRLFSLERIIQIILSCWDYQLSSFMSASSASLNTEFQTKGTQIQCLETCIFLTCSKALAYLVTTLLQTYFYIRSRPTHSKIIHFCNVYAYKYYLISVN